MAVYDYCLHEPLVVLWSSILLLLVMAAALEQKVVAWFPAASSIYSWGKVGGDSRAGTSRTCPGTASLFKVSLMVPNRYFKHFYVVGVVWSGFVLLALLRCSVGSPDISIIRVLSSLSNGSQSSLAEVVMAESLLFIHILVRLAESWAYTRFGSTMHLAHYLYGMLFYMLVPITVAAAIPGGLGTEVIHSPIHKTRWIAGGFLYVAASWQQWTCHRVLSALKSPRGQYAVPSGGMFNWVSCPHYLCEIGIYASIGLVLGPNYAPWSVTVCVVSTLLGYGAYKTHCWYSQTFRSLPNHWRALVPFLF